MIEEEPLQGLLPIININSNSWSYCQNNEVVYLSVDGEKGIRVDGDSETLESKVHDDGANNGAWDGEE